MYRIRCYTLFDITKTGVMNRKPPTNSTAEYIEAWEHKRNTQCNFDTILQVISLRAQPEEISAIKQKEIEFAKSDYFGFLFEGEEVQPYWTFDFTVYQEKVFDNSVNSLGYLIDDCDGVPMVQVNTQWDKLTNFLDVSPELRNIHFEILRDE